LKTDAPGLQAEDYETDRVFLTELYSGMFDLSLAEKDVAEYRANGEIKLPKKGNYYANEYCPLHEETNLKRTALTTVDPAGKKLNPIVDVHEGVWGIKPRNREQHFAFDALLDDRIKSTSIN